MRGLEDCTILSKTLAAVLTKLLVTADNHELFGLKLREVLCLEDGNVLGRSMGIEDGTSLGKRLGLEAGTVFVSLEGSTMLGKTLVAVKAGQ